MNECIKISSDSLIKVEECGRKVIFRNSGKANHRVGKIDDCLIKEGIRADYFVSNDDVAVIVELKGCDIDHAINQLFTAVDHQAVAPFIEGRAISLLIVCSRFPKNNTSVQRAQAKAVRKNIRRLRVVCNQRKLDLATLADIQ